MKNKDITGRFLLRLLLSPFLFFWGCFLLLSGTLFPLPLIVVISIVGMISVPFVWILRKSGSEIDYIEPFMCVYFDFENDKNVFIQHLLGATIYLWGAFAVVYLYVKTGKIFTG